MPQRLEPHNARALRLDETLAPTSKQPRLAMIAALLLGATSERVAALGVFVAR
jgi:hypothetical protein